MTTSTLSSSAPPVAPHAFTLPFGAEMPALLWLPAPQTATGDTPVPGAVDGTPAAEVAAPPIPAIVMLPDYFGFDETLLRAGARLCALGCAVLCADLTHGTGVPAPDAAAGDFGDWMLKQSDSSTVKKALAALDYLAALEGVDAGRLGIMGWGWSGSLALMAACHDAPVRVACDIGGEISYPVMSANRPGSPLNFIGDLQAVLFAAFPGADPAFASDEILRLRNGIVENDCTGEVKVYESAPPRFWRTETLPQTRALWRRMEAFLSENLTGASEGIEPLGAYANESSRLHA